MSRDLKDLSPLFMVRVDDLLRRCATDGYPMKPFFTLRSPQEQGRLWRQSRTTATIRNRVAELRGADASFLADCIEHVGPQNGPHVTNAIPGLSWHQWGEAVDCFWLVNGGAEWSTPKPGGGANGYAHYAEVARGLGLEAGGLWRNFQDWPHVQLRAEGHPGRLYSLEEIDAEMKRIFGG